MLTFASPRFQMKITEFQEWHNRRPLDTIECMKSIVSGGVDKRLTYDELVHEEQRAE